MRKNYSIFLFLIFVMPHQFVLAQCAIILTTNSTNSTCTGCNNGTASVSASGGTAPYIYVWTNNVSTGTATIAPSKDNSIYEENTGNSNGAGQNFVAGQTNAGFKNRALLAFDIAGHVPSGATVSSTNLKINMLFTSGASGSQAQSLHKLLQNWGEGASVATQAGQGVPAAANDATWTKTFFPSNDWTAVGGTFNATASAATMVDQQAIYTWSSAAMISDVQSWLNTPSANFGWLLKGDETGNRQAKRYGSRENVVPGNAPVLTVNYGPTVVGNTSSISNLAPGTYSVTVTDALSCSATAIVTILPFTAQTEPDATTYRGAFDPAQPQWTDSWTSWDPQNNFYPAATVTKSGIIGTQTWTKNNVYLLDGPVYVDSLATLTIEAGTVIRGNDLVANSSLVVTRGAQIIANGTACNPIVFTSNKSIGTRTKGDWGGVIILGRGINNGGTQNLIEGLAPANLDNYHGGTVAADNSGTLKYVRIEYGGYVLSLNNEINGLTMGSVGSGTSIDHIQVSFTNDDAFEWFGGSVNCNYLVAYRNLDDDFDTDNGFDGTIQFALGVKDPTIADAPAVSTSEGFESDNNAGGTAAAPKTKAKFYNVTQIGAFRCGSNAGPITQPTADGFRRGARLRRVTELKIYNSIFMNNWRGLLIDAGTFTLGLAEFKNNIIAMDLTTVWAAPYAGVALAGEDANSTNFLNAAANTNTTITTPCDLLVKAWDFVNPDYRPNAAGSGGAVAGTDLSPLIEIDNALFTANQATDFLADVLENGVGNSNGTITVTIPKLSGWNITVPGLTLTGTFQSGSNTVSNVNGGTPNTNGDWNFRDDGTNIVAQSKVGITLPQFGFVQLGFTATRKGTTPNGTNQSLAVNISGGGDNAAANNGAVNTLSAN